MSCWPEQDQLVVHASKNPCTSSNPYPPTRILNWPYVRKRLSYGDRLQVFLISIPRHLSLSIRTFSNLTTLAWSSYISKVISRRAEDDIPPISPSAFIFSMQPFCCKILSTFLFRYVISESPSSLNITGATNINFNVNNNIVC